MTELDHTQISLELFNMLPKEQVDIVMRQEMCDIEPVFLGFVSTYKLLSQIIPKHFTIVDLGCAYNPQCYYFKDHKKYVGVDILTKKVFMTPNCEFYNMTIDEFIDGNIHKFNIDETFAICNYVPVWYKLDANKIRRSFKNLFCYYPHGGDSTVPIRS